MKKTKIICTLGPSTYDENTIHKMVLEGMNVVRYNFSHAKKDEILKVNQYINNIRKKTNRNIGILYDTKGPEFRCGQIQNGEVNLTEGLKLKIVKEEIIGSSKAISVNHPKSLSYIKVNDTILIDDGLIKLLVIGKDKEGLICVVERGGILKSNKSISVPGRNLKIPFLSDADLEDILFAINNDADFLALSFVSCKEEINQIKKILKDNNSNTLIISKIESRLGVQNIKEIVNASDGVMVARGDLGVEVDMEKVPFIQRNIINECRKKGKIVIVATEMLESMTYNPRPTRAEISDVANSVLNGTDAVMLSGETSIGKNPVETVKMMSDICVMAESNLDYEVDFKHLKKDIKNAIASSAVETANIISAKAIVAATMTGKTARTISNLRSVCPIIATCTDEKVARSLALSFGVFPKITKKFFATDEVIKDAALTAKKTLKLKKDDIVIITGAHPVDEQTNIMKIEKI